MNDIFNNINQSKSDLNKIKNLYLEFINNLYNESNQNEVIEKQIMKNIKTNDKLFDDLNNELDIIYDKFENKNNYLKELKNEVEITRKNYIQNFLTNNYEEIFFEKLNKLKENVSNDDDFLENINYKINESNDIIDKELENINQLLNL